MNNNELSALPALTEKQEKFWTTYETNGRNATAAYRVAYDCSNWTEKSINEEACKLLKHTKILPRIQAAQLLRQAVIEQKLKYTALQSFDKLKEIQELALLKHPENGTLYNLPSAIKAEVECARLAGLHKDTDAKPTQFILTNIQAEEIKLIMQRHEEDC